MTELYRLLAEADSGRQNVVVTLLEGSDTAEKALISEGKMIWCSADSGFLAKHEPELAAIRTSGIIGLDGRKIYCEAVGREKSLVVCGGGHVSIPIIQIGKMMGFHITVLEDRPKFADNARRAGADTVLCEPFEKGLDRIAGSRDTFFVIVTRGHRFDQVCLEKIAAKDYAYIGMIGSRRRTDMVKQILKEKGVDGKTLDEVYTPIGLDIGAETPTEIAVAIMAEIIEVKNRKKGVGCYDKDLLNAILNEDDIHGGKVLVTIVSRKGSAPREAGAKMLVMEDGTCVGTIGGGCAEADVAGRARRMLSSPTGKKIQLYHVDMTNESSEDEGMVCGGNIDVLMEVIEKEKGRKQEL